MLHRSPVRHFGGKAAKRSKNLQRIYGSSLGGNTSAFNFDHSQVSCLVLVESSSGIHMRITINAPSLLESSDFVLSQLEAHSAARNMILLVKYLVNCQYARGDDRRMSSFALSLFVISFFQVS